MSVLKIRDNMGTWHEVLTIKGDRGDTDNSRIADAQGIGRGDRCSNGPWVDDQGIIKQGPPGFSD